MDKQVEKLKKRKVESFEQAHLLAHEVDDEVVAGLGLQKVADKVNAKKRRLAVQKLHRHCGERGDLLEHLAGSKVYIDEGVRSDRLRQRLSATPAILKPTHQGENRLGGRS
jgi:hypothetical protein